MHIVENRITTFYQSHRIAKCEIRWPHTKPDPESLAFAGFYYKPLANLYDNVVCYLCGEMVEGWEDTDDPLQKHIHRNKSCAWALLRNIVTKSKNGQECVSDADDPQSEAMNILRQATFGKWWPHDDKKGWNPNSKTVYFFISDRN